MRRPPLHPPLAALALLLIALAIFAPDPLPSADAGPSQGPIPLNDGGQFVQWNLGPAKAADVFKPGQVKLAFLFDPATQSWTGFVPGVSPATPNNPGNFDLNNGATLFVRSCGPQVLTVVHRFDFGDAPASYGTLLANNGARHEIQMGFYLGLNPPFVNDIDGEPDGQPTDNARGDDLGAPKADENGVFFASPVVPGQTVTFELHSSLIGVVDAWIDRDFNGTFDAGERFWTNKIVDAGFTPGTIQLPPVVVPGYYIRFRLSENGVNSPIGPGGIGEVEDYFVAVDTPLDFGDAPDSYGTLFASNGARHAVDETFFLGPVEEVATGLHLDAENDGLPGPAALGDDLAPPAFDESGVTFLDPVVPGAPMRYVVHASKAGLVDAWIDEDFNGTFDPGEALLIGALVFPGANPGTLTLPLPPPEGSDGEFNGYYLRFRLSQAGVAGPTGFGGVGEVEDYFLPATEEFSATLTPLDGPFAQIDFGGAPPGATVTATVQVEDAVVLLQSAIAGAGGTGSLVLRGDCNAEANIQLTDASTVLEFIFLGGADDSGKCDAIELLDFGDAPRSYGTRALDDGAAHLIAGLRLGAEIDGERSGAPSLASDGDDSAATDDEDGVDFIPPFVIPGGTLSFDLSATVPGPLPAQLSVWLDVDGDGAFQADELLLFAPLADGLSTFVIEVPAGALPNAGRFNLRFRLSDGTTTVGPVGFGGHGEVEDYSLQGPPPAPGPIVGPPIG